MEDVIKVVRDLQRNRKYGHLYELTLARVIQKYTRQPPIRNASKLIKRELHEIWGAFYETRPDWDKLFVDVEQSAAAGESMQSICCRLMRLQNSTAERLSVVDDFYTGIFNVTGRASRIADFACGLNPLSIPWMPLDAECHYFASDIDGEEISFLQRCMRLFEPQLPCHVTVELGDILVDTSGEYDVVFLLKVLPLLERMQKGVSIEILDKIDAKFVVVSYPVASLSGKKKGMVDFYDRQFRELSSVSHWKYTRLYFESELVFIIEK